MLKSASGAAGKTYLLTQTLFEHLSAFSWIGLQIPPRDFIEEIEKKVGQLVEEMFAGTQVSVETLSASDLFGALVSSVQDVKKSNPELVFVSTAPLMAYEVEGECVHLNRLIDCSGELIGIGPRPGHPKIEAQLSYLPRGEKSLVIIEDGSFTGGTMQALLGILGPERVRTIVLGILFPRAADVLEKNFDGEVICNRNEKDDLIDWVPSHDFLPFMPNNGRVVGSFLGKSCFPVYLYNHASLCMPYILPYGRPEEWASIRGEKAKICQFSIHCIQLALQIFEEMERINGKKITVQDVVFSSPRTSLPIAPNQGGFTELSERVTSILSEDIKYLA